MCAVPGSSEGCLCEVLAEAGVAASRTATTSHVVEKTGLGGLMVMEEVKKKILIGFYRLNLLPVL